MKPRERVMTALKRGIPDQVPWIENDVEEDLQVRIMGTTEFTPGELCEKLGMDGFGCHFPLGESLWQGREGGTSSPARTVYPITARWKTCGRWRRP
jgi:hypothetical protein